MANLLPPGTGDESLTIAQNMKPDMSIVIFQIITKVEENLSV
jgi:Mrp family chromosome partitioning ATPase